VIELVVGVGTSSDATPGEVAALVHGALAGAGLPRDSVVALATIATKSEEPAIVDLGWPVTAYSATELGAVEVPHPSAAVGARTGTASVAEAAALMAAGAGAELVVTKQASAHATVAVARRASR